MSSWQDDPNNNNPRRPPEPRRYAPRSTNTSEYTPLGVISAQSLANMADNATPLPRMIAAARERLFTSNRERINSILGDSPYTTRRWTQTPAEAAERLAAERLNRERQNPPPSRRLGPGRSSESAPQITTSIPLTLTSSDFISQSPYPNRMTSLEQLDRTLDEANAHLRALLDMTSANSVSRQLLPPPPPPAAPPPLPALSSSASPRYTPPPPRTHDYTYDAHHQHQQQQRSKRRKVDAERYAQGMQQQTFRYGHYGQVEPGHLEMEIVSCDGGMFSNELLYSADNILKDDSSVYCTKGNRCNIVLRHRGSTTFTLSELVIKGPASLNYSHPIREGMVFIAMEQDDALNRTAQYKIQYAASTATAVTQSVASPLRDRVTFSHTDSRLGSSRVPQQTVSISHNRDGSTTTRNTHSYIYSSSNENDVRMPQMPQEFTTSQPDVNIITECSDEDDSGGTTAMPISILRRTTAPNRIGSLPFEQDGHRDSDSEDEEDEDGDHNIFGSEDSMTQRGGVMTPAAARSQQRQLMRRRHARQHHLASNTTTVTSTPTPNLLNVNFDLTSGLSGGGDNSNSNGNGNGNGNGSTGMFPSASLTEAWDAHANATQEAIRAVGGGALLAPHARFHIEKKKSKCTIRFDPPVSGRFLLLKVWSSQHDPGSNIDIQSVIARGFAGPRYFPNVEML